MDGWGGASVAVFVYVTFLVYLSKRIGGRVERESSDQWLMRAQRRAFMRLNRKSGEGGGRGDRWLEKTHPSACEKDDPPCTLINPGHPMQGQKLALASKPQL